MDSHKLPNLQREVKMMVNMGYYSLFVLQAGAYPGAKYVLYTDVKDQVYLLDDNGDIFKQGNLGRFPVAESVNFPSIRNPYATRK